MVKKYLYVGLVLLLSLELVRGEEEQSDPSNTSTITWADKLKKDILSNYDPTLRPAQHYNATNVRVSITILHVEINEVKSIFSVYGWVKMEWYDKRFEWDPYIYENVSTLLLNHSAVWKPTADETSSTFQVTNDGNVEQVFALNAQSKCTINWRKWPFDTQECSVMAISWSESEGLNVTTSIDLKDLTQGTMWVLESVRVENLLSGFFNSQLNGNDMHLTLTVQRIFDIYRHTIIAPALVLILMNLVNFWLPPKSSDKLVLNCMNLLTISIYLIYFNEHMAYYTNTTPLVVLFFSNNLYTSSACLLLSVIVANIYQGQHKAPLHAWIRRFIHLKIVHALVLGNIDSESHTEDGCEAMEEDELEDGGSSLINGTPKRNRTNQNEWITFAILIERIAFLIYALQWNDEKLKWNKENYGGLDVLRLNPSLVWKPDVVLYNNAGHNQLHYGPTNVLVYNGGNVLWVPPTEYHAFCELNLKFWPFDYQKCFLKIGSWTFDGYKLNLTLEGETEIDILVHNGEWDILKVTAERNLKYYSCCTEPYPDIMYNVTIQRQSNTHKAIVITPALVIIILALSVFWLPVESGQRIVLNGFIALMVTIFLIYFAQQLPAMSGQTPLIVSFFSNTLYLIAFSTLISVIVLNVSRSEHSSDAPGFLVKIIDGCLGSTLGVGKSHSPLAEGDKEPVEADPNKNWKRLGLFLNRLSFVVYCTIFIVYTLYYSI